MRAVPIQQRFEQKVALVPFSDCHYWTGASSKFGYGKLSNGKNSWVFAHRFAYEQKHGEIPEDKFVLHHCDNPACVNAEHLYIGSKKDNAIDRENRNRGNHASGVGHGRSKLSTSQVRDIRDEFDTGKYSFRQLGRIYGVDGKSIADIVNRLNWQYVLH
jgi:hypothetical protein